MTKKEYLESLGKELERLEKVEHVSDLANHWRCAEVDAIIATIDYSALNEFMGECNGGADLKVSEIPDGRYFAFIVYLSGSNYDEVDVMACWDELQEKVRECGKAGEAIANTMDQHYVNVFDTFEELLNGKCADEE